MMLQAWHTCIWGVFLILLCRFSQVLSGWMDGSPEMFDRVQVRALARPFKDIQRLVSKSLLHCLDCVVTVVVLLEGEPSPLSEFLSTVEQVFIKDLSVLAPFIFPSILTSLPGSAAEKHPHSMMLPPPCFTIGMVPCFLQI